MSTRMPAAERREQLLDVALELFARFGYARTTTSQLAKEAGVTEPIIYRHFASKKNLFIALIERTGRETLDQWQDDLKGATDPAQRLQMLLGDNPMVAGKGRASYRVILQAISEVDDEQIRAAVHDHFRTVHEFLMQEVLVAQAAHKVARRFSAENIAWLLTYIGLGYGVVSAMGVEGHGIDSTGRHVKDAVGRMLVGRDAQEPHAEGGADSPPSTPDQGG